MIPFDIANLLGPVSYSSRTLATPALSAVNILEMHGPSSVSVTGFPAAFIFGDSTSVKDPGPDFTA